MPKSLEKIPGMQSNLVVITPVSPMVGKRYRLMLLKEYQLQHPVMGMIKKAYYKLTRQIP
jgi:hypothetical protein